MARSDCTWRMLPHDFPPWKTVYSAFRRWHQKGLFEETNARLGVRLSVVDGRPALSSAAVADTQSVKTTEKGGARPGRRQAGEGQKAPPRRRHTGPRAGGQVHAADVQDRARLAPVLTQAKQRTFAWLGRYRPLSKDYEALCSTSEAWVWLALSRRLLSCLTELKRPRRAYVRPDAAAA